MAFISCNSRLDGTNKTYDVTKTDSSRHVGGSRVTIAGNNEADKVCNIYDLSSNCCEYSTETYTYNSSPCVWRGGTCRSSNTYAFSGYRTVTNTSGSTTPDKDYTTFRCILFKL